MRNTNKIRAGITTAVLVFGLGAAGTGVAFAAPAAAPTAALAQVSPANNGVAPMHTAPQMVEMDQMMAQKLPGDQRDAATTRMLKETRPRMAKMMSKNTDSKAQMDCCTKSEHSRRDAATRTPKETRPAMAKMMSKNTDTKGQMDCCMKSEHSR